MRFLLAPALLLLSTAAFAQSPVFEGIIEEYCSLRFAGASCSGLGCSSQAIIRHERPDKIWEEIVTLDFGSTPNGTDFGLPEAVLGKALLQLGKDGWELEFVDHDPKSDRLVAGEIYHLKRMIRFTTRG